MRHEGGWWMNMPHTALILFFQRKRLKSESRLAFLSLHRAESPLVLGKTTAISVQPNTRAVSRQV